MRSYFNENPTYLESYFRRRFWMSINFFKHIATEVMKFDRFFEQRRNAVGELGHISEGDRRLAYVGTGIPADLQFKGHRKDATIVLEAVADHETWIWHAFFWNARFLQ
jgi:hypothetical protein